MGSEVPFESLFSEQHKVTTARQVLGIFQCAIRARSPMNLILESSQSLHTVLIGADEHALVFDEMLPRDPHRKASLQGALCVFRHDGMFAGFVIEDAKPQGDETTQCAFPDDLHLLQRRMHYRVEVSSQDISSVQIIRKGAPSCHGLCLDLSAGGMRLALREAPSIPLSSMEELEHVAFSIGDKMHYVPARVRSVMAADARTPLRVGLSFEGLPLPAERDIALYVQRRDRELLRIRSTI